MAKSHALNMRAVLANRDRDGYWMEVCVLSHSLLVVGSSDGGVEPVQRERERERERGGQR